MNISLPFLALLAILSASPTDAAPSEKRLALVIGNASYHAKTLPTPVNDAALIAQTLQAAGFDVIGARDLDGDSLRQAFRHFVDAVAQAGPDAVAAVYFAGYGLQLEGENYLVPIDADIISASDVPRQALRLSDQAHALAALSLKTTFVVLDAARASPFALSGRSLAGGLAWVEPETNMLIGFNAAPGTVAPDGRDTYGPYAKALAEMIREGGLTPANVFDRVRLRVNELTKGAQVPWHASKVETQFVFFERSPAAPARADSPAHTARMRSQPMLSLGADDAYMVALLRDTFDGYADYLADYANTPMAKRVRAMLAARREAITWRRAYQANVAAAYWTYLKRYPHGPHTADAGRLLAHLGAASEPPSEFATINYDIPLPLPEEFKYFERPVLVFDDPAFAFEPPPPSPAHFLEPPQPEVLALEPPAAPRGSDSLPTPVIAPLPAYVRVPGYVVASAEPLVFNQRHQTLVVNNMDSIASKPDDNVVSSAPISPPRTAADTPDPVGSPLPSRSVATMAMLFNRQNPSPPVRREEINSPPGKPLPETSSIPAVSTDDQSLATARLATPAPPSDTKPAPLPTATPDPQASGSIPPRTASPQAIGDMPVSQSLTAKRSIAALPTGDLASGGAATFAPTAGDTLPPVPGPATPAFSSTPLRSPAIPSPQASGSMPPSQPLLGMSLMPGLPTDDHNLANARIATLAPTTGNEPPPVLGPEMLAPPPTGSIPLLTPPIVSPPAIGSIPLPVPRPAFPARATASQVQPIPRAASMVAPIAAGQATGAGKPPSPPAVASAPKPSPGVLQPPTQLCPVVSGRRICN